MIDLVSMFQKHTDQDHMISKSGMMKMMKENFPNFLKTYMSRGTSVHTPTIHSPATKGAGSMNKRAWALFWAHDPEKKDMNKNIAQLLSILGNMAIDIYRQSQGAAPSSSRSQ
ncbi:protein S100-A7-like [Dipodomys merriami]|uniref:protein S100-A7-like n=1 Tax=Dipodomys merriami TaxID=94247 RepID=UPI003855FDCA